jgi:hypothetical protein
MGVGKLFNNRLLLGTILALAIYWGTAVVATGAFMTAVVGILLLSFGGLNLLFYSATAYRVVVIGDRSDIDAGSHLAVYGAWLLSFGAVWSGCFRLLWIYYQQPDTWTGTAYSGFGSACMAVGFLHTFLGPQATETGVRVVGTMWIVGAVIIGLCAGMLLGTQLDATAYDPFRIHRSYSGDRPWCPPDREVWGAASGVYHSADSPYRSQVVPTRCFKTVAEAEAAGFRPARK